MNSFSLSRAFAIFKKEVFHIARDPFTMGVAIALPVVMAFIFGYAMEFNIKEIPTAYLDSDYSATSRSLIAAIGSSEYFKLTSVRVPAEGLALMQSDKVKAFVIIPPNFEKNVIGGVGEDVQVLIDGTDGSFVGAIGGYLSLIGKRVNENIGAEVRPSPLQTRTRFLFNSELNSKWFSIPGITVVIMAILCSLLTTLTVAREWENGSMELLLSTPVQPIEVIVGKLAPYAALCFAAVVFVYGLARFWFNVPFVGSHLIYAFACLIFLLGNLAMGLAISVIFRKQLTAMQTGLMVGMLPSSMLSGFIFPIENMPFGFQLLTMPFPARWFMTIARDQFLQGSRFLDLVIPFSALIAICSLLVLFASLQFKRDLE